MGGGVCVCVSYSSVITFISLCEFCLSTRIFFRNFLVVSLFFVFRRLFKELESVNPLRSVLVLLHGGVQVILPPAVFCVSLFTTGPTSLCLRSVCRPPFRFTRRRHLQSGSTWLDGWVGEVEDPHVGSLFLLCRCVSERVFTSFAVLRIVGFRF